MIFRLKKLFLASYYKQLSADINKYFVSPEMSKARAHKTGFNIMIVHFIFVKKWIEYNMIHDFLVWLRTGSYPPDINRF